MTDIPSTFAELNQYQHQPHRNGEWAHPYLSTMTADQYARTVEKHPNITLGERAKLKEKILAAEALGAHLTRPATGPAPIPSHPEQWNPYAGRMPTDPHIRPASEWLQPKSHTKNQHAENTRAALQAAAISTSHHNGNEQLITQRADTYLAWLTTQQEKTP